MNKLKWASLNAQYFLHKELVEWIIQQILTQDLMGFCLQEAARFQRELLDKIVNDPRLEGKWAYIQIAEPELMGFHHGVATFYRTDILSLTDSKQVWLPKCSLSKQREVALITTFKYEDEEFDVANIRFAYEDKNEFRFMQLSYVAGVLHTRKNVCICGDTNFKHFSQVSLSLKKVLSLFTELIPAEQVVENRNRERLTVLAEYTNLIPPHVHTIEPFRSLHPAGGYYKANALYSRVRKHLLGKPANIRLLMQLDYALVKGVVGQFVDVQHTQFSDHSMIVFAILI